MFSFKKWYESKYNENIEQFIGKNTSDYTAIDRVYDKSDLAVRIVQDYDTSTKKNTLLNISYIMPLNDAGKWGLYNSAENRNVLGEFAKNKFKFDQEMLHKLESIPLSILKDKKYNIDPAVLNDIKKSDTIRVNVLDIYKRFNDEQKKKLISPEEAQINIIKEIASTIIHESKHDEERRNEELTGKPMTGEIGPLQAEKDFKTWFERNLERLKQSYPEILSVK